MKNKTNRDHVVEVSAQMFFNNGYANTSMDEIMRESGVSKSNIYYHFASKEDIAVAVAQWWVKKYEDLIASIMERGDLPLPRKFSVILEAFAEGISADPAQRGCPFISLYVQCKSASVRERIRIFFKELVQLMEKPIALAQASKEIRTDIPASEIAAMFVSSMEGALMIADISGDSNVIRTTGNVLLRLL